jgi:hypothetical protein
MKSLKMTSSSGAWVGTLNKLKSRIMKRPTTTQNSRFFTREFIHLSFAGSGQSGDYRESW